MERTQYETYYDEIYKKLLEFPQYQGDSYISEFEGRFARHRFKDSLGGISDKLLAEICLYITNVDRVYRDVRKEKFPEKQSRQRKVKEQKYQQALGYEVGYYQDTKKGKTL